MTNAALTRTLNAARKTLVRSAGMTRGEHTAAMVSALHALPSGWDLGRSEECDKVAGDLRREITWNAECGSARSVHAPRPAIGFAAELRIAAAMAGR